MFMPFHVLGIWFRGLLSLVFLGCAIFLLTQWYRYREVVVVEQVRAPREEVISDGEPGATVAEERRTIVPWQFGFNRETAFLLGGVILVAWSIGGGWILSPGFFRRRGADEPKKTRPSNVRRIQMPDGSYVGVEISGPADGVPVVFTHGWGLDGDEWYYSKKYLEEKYRVITWDLPGLGTSDRPTDRDWSLEKLAQTLEVVIAEAGTKPVVLVGHSIGVMITLTYCKVFPQALGGRVRALALAHGTYTNPLKTTARGGLYRALQKPVLEPLCHLMVWLSPVFRALNWLSYLNGSAARSTERDSFSGQETRGQLEFITRQYCKAAPDVLGRGMLAMLKYDATEVLGRIPVPTLVVAGDRDGTCLPEASRYMAQTIPHTRLVVLTQAKHLGFFEHHERFHDAMVDFLASEHGGASDQGVISANPGARAAP